MTPSLSALIIAKDEQRALPSCLKSLDGLAQEVVVVVDDATRDGTEEIARAAGCKVLRRYFDDYARQRQAALDACTKDWVLWVDCDESPNLRLKAEVRNVLSSSSLMPNAYKIAFSVYFLGQELRFGGLGRETHTRLFRRGKARFVGGALHESLEIEGAIGGPLPGKMEHRPYEDLSDYLQKLDRYTTLAAGKKYAAGRRFHWWQHGILPWELMKRLLFRLAILDGNAGVSFACLSAFHHWLKYVKLREMERAR